MILTTTPSIEGKTISDYCGIVTGEAILGANLFRDFFAGVRDIVGGRSASYEKELHRAREIALKELAEEAEKVGANAIVGIDLDYEVVGQGGSMLIWFSCGPPAALSSMTSSRGRTLRSCRPITSTSTSTSTAVASTSGGTKAASNHGRSTVPASPATEHHRERRRSTTKHRPRPPTPNMEAPGARGPRS